MPEYFLNNNALNHLELKNGMRANLWIACEPQIGKFIEKYRLKAVNRRTLGVADDLPSVNMLAVEHLIGIRGGRRVAHLHYKGELYMMKSSQWREFSQSIVMDMSKRLAKSKQVNLTELIEVTEAIGAIVR